MAANASYVHQRLLFGTAIAAIGTLLFYATGVDWSWAWHTQNVRPAAIAYLISACFGALPYGLLVALLSRFRASPLLQVLSFVLVVGLSVAAFGWWRLQGINTVGWDFLLVPVWQIGLIAVLYGARRVAKGQ